LETILLNLEKKIGSGNIEEIWNGDKEKEKLKTEYFGVGDLEVSNNDKFLAYSLDTKGSEYYTIFVREIETNKNSVIFRTFSIKRIC
jgi:oligopeptidase B